MIRFLWEDNAVLDSFLILAVILTLAEKLSWLLIAVAVAGLVAAVYKLTSWVRERE